MTFPIDKPRRRPARTNTAQAVPTATSSEQPVQGTATGQQRFAAWEEDVLADQNKILIEDLGSTIWRFRVESLKHGASSDFASAYTYAEELPELCAHWTTSRLRGMVDALVLSLGVFEEELFASPQLEQWIGGGYPGPIVDSINAERRRRCLPDIGEDLRQDAPTFPAGNAARRRRTPKQPPSSVASATVSSEPEEHR